MDPMAGVNTETSGTGGGASPAAIETRAVTKRFSSREALRNVNLRVERGSTYGLIGLNGAGKSSLIRALVGLLPPSEGVCVLGGVDVWKDRVKAIGRVGYVPDRPHVYPWMTVAGAVRFASQMWASWDAEVAERLLKQYRLDRTQRCGKLSKGQGAKLSLLLALAHNPEILILDEPTDGLDPVSRDEFLEDVLDATMVREAAPGGVGERSPRTVLISSHSLGDLERLADTIGILHGGELVVQERTEKLLGEVRRYRAALEDDGDRGSRGSVRAKVSGLVYERVRGREWALTVRGESGRVMEEIRGAMKVGSIDVLPVSLEDVFKDVVKGKLAEAEVTS